MQIASHTPRNWNHKPHCNAKGEPTGTITVGESWSYTQQITLINPTCRGDYKSFYVLWFGAYGWTRLHVYADHLEDALEELYAYVTGK